MSVLYALELVGTFVSALSGAIEAHRRRLDLFGIVAVAVVTAIGGGSVRDVLLGRRAFWIDDTNYLLLAVLAALLCALCYRNPGRAFWRELFLAADALALAVFTVVGIHKGILAETSAAVALALGVATTIGGGMMRDLLCGEIPLVLRREIYAVAALAGGVLFLWLHGRGTDFAHNAPLTIAAVFIIRMLGLRLRISLALDAHRDEFPDDAPVDRSV